LLAMTTTTTTITTNGDGASFDVLGEVTLVEHSDTDDDGQGIINSDHNDDAVSICWKPDGSLFAVSCCIPAATNSKTSATTSTPQQQQQQQQPQQQRVVRIYDRHGDWQQSSSPVAIGRVEDGSGRLLKHLSPWCCNMAWAGPACSQLLAVATASTTTTTSSYSRPANSNADATIVPAGTVYFLEPNGLQHGQLTLRHDPQDVDAATASSSSSSLPLHVQQLPVVNIVGLTWNCTFDVLAVTMQCIYTSNNSNAGGDNNSSIETTTTTVVDKVQLWHRCNYHWYLKYELRFTNGERIVMLQQRQQQQPLFDSGSAVAAVTFHEEQPYVACLVDES
jgi:hypothetical protein